MSIKHTTTVDIGDLRTLSKPIHLMQYDKSLPEIEVHITKDGQEYTIPSGYSATIRWGKPDKHGCTATGTVSGSTVTFQVTEQMACVAGRSNVTVEIVESDSSQAGTAKFEVIVDSNPIGDNTIVSDSEIADIQKAIEAGQNAEKAIETATAKANEASTSATTASQKAEEAKDSAETAIQTKSEIEALKDEVKAETSKAGESESKAKEYADQASSYASLAGGSSESAGRSAASALSSAESASSSAASASESETNARKSELNAKTSEEKSAESESNSKVFYDKIVATQFPYNLEGLSQLEKEITARYESARTGKVFAIRHKKFAVDPSPIGEKLLDSVGLECTPSTDTVQGKDDFMQYLPFQWEHCNYIRDEDDGFARPTAIEGRENYKNSGNVDVGCISATFWWKRVDTEADYTIYLSDMPHPELALVPWYEAVKADGSVLPYYIGSAYSSVNGDDGLPRSLPGGVPLYNQSHNGNIVLYQKKGKGYWGCGYEYITHGAIFSEIKYGTPNIQQYAQGCVGFNAQKKCAVAETATTRVLIDKQDPFYVGCCVSVGVARTSDGNTDRGLEEIHSIANRVKVKAIKTVEIGETSYCALYLDIDAPINVDTETYVTTMPCFTGETDAVIDHYDGSFTSCSNNNHTFRLHGREYLDGMYFTSANTAMLMKDGSWHVMHARKGMQHNTELTGYDDVGYIPYNDGTDYWCGDWGCDMATGTSHPSSVGKSNAMGAGDMVYVGGKNVNEGEKRNHLCLGRLMNLYSAGLFFVSCWAWVGDGWWYCASRD